MTPAKQFADERGLYITYKDDVHSQDFCDLIRLICPDLLFVCDFGQILKDRVLSASILGGVNLHGSLLPKYRGAAPVHWAILNGDSFTGVSVIRMTSKVDAGEVIAQSPPMPIPPFATLEEVEEMLAEYGAKLVVQTLRKMASDKPVNIVEQPDSKVTKAPRLKKENGLINWNDSAISVFNHYRAMSQWPKSFTHWQREDGSSVRLILGKVLPLDNSFREVIQPDFSAPKYVPPVLVDAKLDNLAELRSEPDVITQKKQNRKLFSKTEPKKQPQHQPHRPDWWKPGMVVKADEGELIIAAGEETVQVLQLQPDGKRMMNAADFLRGNPMKVGDMLS